MGTRRSMARFMAEEMAWWSNADERLLGLVFRDRTDDDYAWMILARDAGGRFRCIDLETSLRSSNYAETGLRIKMAGYINAGNLDALGLQGDEPETIVDLITVPDGVSEQKLHPYFKLLVEDPGRAPARAIIREMGPWLAPKDAHLVREFQQHQFDQRLWELYLWAALRELSFDVEYHEAPDFSCRSPLGEFALEATTVAPSAMGPLAAHPNPKTEEEMEQFINNYMPLKYGSSLMSKLNKTSAYGKHYWELEPAKDKPFLFAIADFHKAANQDELGSMTYTQSSIWQYLYGTRVTWQIVDGSLVLTPTKVTTHKYLEKEAPSGFFDHPLAKHVSAVMFSNAGTIAKFDRMGVLAGYGAAGHAYHRFGLRPNPDPNSPVGIPFHAEVGVDDYEEMWSDELQIFHNPNALRPLDDRVFAEIAQHRFVEGDLVSRVPPYHVISSFTSIFRFVREN